MFIFIKKWFYCIKIDSEKLKLPGFSSGYAGSKPKCKRKLDSAMEYWDSFLLVSLKINIDFIIQLFIKRKIKEKV